MTLKFFDKLSQNFIELLSDKDDYNVIIIVKNEKSFTAHSNVLKCRSPYFCKELKNIISNENNIKTITISNISDEIFDVILKYIYGAIVDLENVETKFIFDLMVISNELEIEELTKKLENHLIETKSSWLKSHFSLVYHSIFGGSIFKDLEKFCNDIVVKYPNLIFDAEDFPSLQESALVSLLKRDDLQLEEVIIWEYIIKWGITQNSTLPVDLKEWTKGNFITLKTTLQQCLPLIRYFHISGKDILKKIKPYKKILDKQLWEDLTQYFMDPDHPMESIILPPRTILTQELPTRATEQTKPLSTIISYEHVAEISSWIDHKSSIYSLTNTPYEFQLILRGSINGFNPQTFWDTCHGHARTVVIMKVKGTEEILGGFNPLAWDNTNTTDVWEKTNDSFIFSLKNGNIQNSILSRKNNNNYAILNVDKKHQKTNGPYFGNDLYMYSPSSNFTLDSNCACNNIDYEKSIRTTTHGPGDNARTEINRKSGVSLPVNRAELKETVDKIRLYYKFPKLPRSWINENYEGKKVLPRLDAVINEMTNKTEDIIVLPIRLVSKIKEVKKLQYYNLKSFQKHERIYKESNKRRTKCSHIYNSTSPGDPNLESNSIRPNTCNSNDAAERSRAKKKGNEEN
ncbi:hypothetical protein Glove_78g118 [Diversispora epigaea]|uniref:BTB domain-containing protein n=1 Tax=Diversispora epigaea TaxID=1348612 RepID=A0A397JJD6_9GLOM|nr:hypothetical protein Glove_78g118 [Diversispora epigaea]